MASATAVVRNLYSGTTSGVLYTDRRNFYLKPSKYAELFPNVTPFLTFTMRANFRTGLQDPVFKLFEHRAPFERRVMSQNSATPVVIAAAATGAAAESGAITVDGFTGLNPSTIDASWEGYQFEVWDSSGTTFKGMVICTEGTGTNTLKVKNLGKTAITTADNDLFVQKGQATEEGVVSPKANSDELLVVFNQAQIFRTPLEITGTLMQASLKGANKDLARLRRNKMQLHKVNQEGAFLWGESPLGTDLDQSSDTFSDLDKLIRATSGKPVRTTTGAASAVRLYGATSGDTQSYWGEINKATDTYDDFVDRMEIAFQYVPNSGRKPCFVGGGVMSHLAKKAMEKNSGWAINVSDSRKSDSGFDIRELITPHGSLDLIYTHSFKYEHKNDMLLIDPANIEYVQYRPSAFRANIKTDDGYDGIKDEYFSDAGLGMTNIKSHQLMIYTG